MIKKLDGLLEVNEGKPLNTLPEAYDEFAIGVVAVGTKFYVIYDTSLIIENLISNAGMTEDQAEELFITTVGTNIDVAFTVMDLKSE
tara:strand:- start:4108 stop:4368 length:261 start_codon:yes stop_codon:yes gene_type:complete